MTLYDFLKNEVDDVDMDSNYIYLKLDKDKYDFPFMTKKGELRSWLLDKFAHKINENNGEESNVGCALPVSRDTKIEYLEEELGIYKKALEYLDTLLFDHCRYSLECYISCEHEFDRCDCLKEGMWAELALKKVGEENV